MPPSLDLPPFPLHQSNRGLLTSYPSKQSAPTNAPSPCTDLDDDEDDVATSIPPPPFVPFANLRVIDTNYKPHLKVNKTFPLEGKDQPVVLQWTNAHRRAAKSAPLAKDVDDLEKMVSTTVISQQLAYQCITVEEAIGAWQEKISQRLH